MRKPLWFFLVALLSSLAWGQPTPGGLIINTSTVNGGTSGQCLKVNTNGTLGQVPGCGGAGTGTVTSVGNLSPLFTTANPTTTPTFSLVSQSQNLFFASPNGSSGVGVFRSIVGADVPTLNQNTTGTAANLSGTPALPNGTTATTQATGDATADLATDSFIASALASINPAVAVQAATIAVLPNTPTYNNGTAGVGATLTSGSNGALVIDGYTVLLNDRILVKNQASTFQNGVYTETTLGTGGVPYVLTRATDYNSTTNINYTGTIPVLQGTTLANTGWNLQTQIAVIGTDALTYTQASAGNSGGPPGGNVKATGNLTNITFIEGAGGKTIQSVTSPNCTDTGGNHLNFASATGAITCGTTIPAANRIRGFGGNFPSAFAVNAVAYSVVPFACTISAWNIMSDATSLTFKVWKIATGTAIPTVANVINTSGLSLSSGTAVNSTTVTDFTTTAVAANDMVAIVITAVAGSPTFAQIFVQCNQ